MKMFNKKLGKKGFVPLVIWAVLGVAAVWGTGFTLMAAKQPSAGLPMYAWFIIGFLVFIIFTNRR